MAFAASPTNNQGVCAEWWFERVFAEQEQTKFHDKQGNGIRSPLACKSSRNVVHLDVRVTRQTRHSDMQAVFMTPSWHSFASASPRKLHTPTQAKRSHAILLPSAGAANTTLCCVHDLAKHGPQQKEREHNYSHATQLDSVPCRCA